MSEQQWITFWEIVLILGLGSYLVLAVVIVPFGLSQAICLHAQRPCQPDAAMRRSDDAAMRLMAHAVSVGNPVKESCIENGTRLARASARRSGKAIFLPCGPRDRLEFN